jgi:hypothetical protein
VNTSPNAVTADHVRKHRGARCLPRLRAGADGRTSGTTPKMKASEVIRIGRNRKP